jgi:hypothetical protein
MKAIRTEHYLESLEIEGRMYAKLGKLLQRYRLLLCPTLPVPRSRPARITSTRR